LVVHHAQSYVGSPFAYHVALSSQQRLPQSAQSDAQLQSEYSAPMPPSSQMSSDAYVQLSEQNSGAARFTLHTVGVLGGEGGSEGGWLIGARGGEGGTRGDEASVQKSESLVK